MNVVQLSAEQKEVLAQFRDNVKDCSIEKTDEFLLRWLVARNFNLELAERMLRQSLEWRKVNGVDQILETWKPPEVLTNYMPFSLFSVDKSGSPVWVYTIGRCDFRGIFESVTAKDFVKYHVYLQEKSNAEMKRISRSRGQVITQQTLLYDMENISWRQITYKPVVENAAEITKMSEAHYPETLRRVIIVNAPKIFALIFALLKPFLHPNTIKKISVFDHNADAWKAALLQEFDADQLPVHYGGTVSDPNGDPRCPSKLCLGGEVPKSYYLSKGKPQPTDDMQTVVIARGSKKSVELQIAVPDSMLKWRFLTDEGDVAFHVYYRHEGTAVDVIPKNRVDCHLAVEEGVIACNQAATYVVEFDNTFSYLRSKRLSYSLVVTEPV